MQILKKKIFIIPSGVKCSLLLILSTILTQNLKSTLFGVCNWNVEKWGIITFTKSFNLFTVKLVIFLFFLVLSTPTPKKSLSSCKVIKSLLSSHNWKEGLTCQLFF